VYVDRIAALFVASASSSHTPIAEPDARSAVPVAVESVIAALPNAVMPDAGAVCRFVVVPTRRPSSRARA
jgi:hypothetical protein